MPQKTVQQLDAYIKATSVVYDHSNAKLISRKAKVKPRRKQAFLSVLHYRNASSDESCAKRRPSKRWMPGQLKCKNNNRSHVGKQKLQIFVRTPFQPAPFLHTPKTLCFRLDPGTSISSLKQWIQKKTGVEARYQRLYIRRNFQLCDLLTLEDNGIEKDENISLRLSFDGLHGGGPKEMPQFAKLLSDIAPKIELTWKELAKNLGFEEADIVNIQATNDSKEQSLVMLFAWWRKQRNSRESSQRLREALEASGLADLALGVPDSIDIEQEDQEEQERHETVGPGPFVAQPEDQVTGATAREPLYDPHNAEALGAQQEMMTFPGQQSGEQSHSSALVPQGHPDTSSALPISQRHGQMQQGPVNINVDGSNNPTFLAPVVNPTINFVQNVFPGVDQGQPERELQRNRQTGSRQRRTGRPELNELFFQRLSRKVAGDWETLAFILSFSKEKVEALRAKHRGNRERQCRAMLRAWLRMQNNDEEARQILRNALIETGREDLERSLLERPLLDVTTTVKRKEEMDEVLTKTFEDFMRNLLQNYGLQCVEEKYSEILDKFISENLQDVQWGSVTFIFRIETREGLDKLWSMYTTGELANKLTKIFITDELTTENKSDLAIQATILESDYERACRFFDELEKDKAVLKSDFRMASDISIQVSPGHFMLPLLINKEININTTVAETKLRDLDHFLRVKTGRPEELAILNVKGLLNLRLHRYEEALDCFHAVLVKDPENLNALANLQYVLEKLFKLAEAGNYREMWHRLLRPVEMATQRDDAIIVKALRKQRRIQARCLAEQAYAHTFDIHSENVSGKRHMQSIELYQKALRLGGDVTDEEQHEWKFCMAINEHKLFTFLPYHNQPDQHDPKVHLEHALKLFSDLVGGGGSVDKEIQWDSWCHLGDIFRTMKGRHMQQNVPHEMRKYTRDPEQCMTKAMKISPDNPRLLVRYATVHYSLNKDRAKSLELLDAALKSDATYWKALSTRATINIKHYNSQRIQDCPELRDILNNAKSDLEKALSMNVTPWDLTKLGEVYYRLAKHHTKEEIAKKSLFQKALVCFSKSVDCPDGRNRSDVHFLRGLCLFDIQEKRAAIGCFKQAIACEPPYLKNTRNFNELLRVYLSILQDENLPKDESILAETAFSLKKALKKYGQPNISKFCISEFTFEHKKELQLLLGYCRKYSKLNELVSLLEKTSFATPRSPRHIHETPRASFGHGMRSPNAGRPMLRLSHHEEADVPQEEAGMYKVGSGASATCWAAEESSPTIQEPAEEVKEQPIKEAPKEARVPDFKYDFIVVYPKSERDWVSYDLLNELEAIRNLKGCTRDRDALAGSMKISSEINLMKESASILLVVNQDFMSECEASMNYALELRKDKQRSRVVIPVLRDDSEVPDEIDMLLNPFNAASGPVDWDKLKFCIEQQI